MLGNNPNVNEPPAAPAAITPAAAGGNPAPAPAAAGADDKAKDGNVSSALGNASAKQTPPAAATPDDKNKSAESTPPAPVNYDSLKVPNGVTVDDKLMGSFKQLAGELKLTPEAAQKLVDMQAQSVQALETRIMQAVRSEADRLDKASHEFFGQKYDEELRFAAKALDKYDAEGKLRAKLKDMPIGNDQDLIAFVAAAGRAIAEDKIINPAAVSANKPQSIAEKFTADANAVFGKK